MEESKLIDIRKLIGSKNPKLLKWIPGFVINYLKRILHQDEINQFIIDHKNDFDQDFCKAVIDYFNIKVVINGLENIPKNGPVILAMNHPLGGMDALALVKGLDGHRNDLIFIVNDLLLHLKNMNGLFVGVNKHGKNQPEVRAQIKQTFESEKALCIFPAGLVSRKIKGNVEDLLWKKTFITYGRMLDRTIVPIYIDGELSNFFYRLANFRKAIGVKANIEMLYLADELFRQRNRTITFTVGKPIQAKEFMPGENDIKSAEAFRKMVHSLKPTK